MRQSFLKSVKNAFKGLLYVIKKERNVQIDIFVAFLVILFSILCHIKLFEFFIVLILIILVISFEILNTIFEDILDFVKPEMHSYIKDLKDILAGMVLLVAIISFVIGLMIFGPYCVKLLNIIWQKNAF